MFVLAPATMALATVLVTAMFLIMFSRCSIAELTFCANKIKNDLSIFLQIRLILMKTPVYKTLVFLKQTNYKD